MPSRFEAMFDIPAYSLPLGLSDRGWPRARIGLALLAEESDFAGKLIDGWSHEAEQVFSPASRCARALLRFMLTQEVEACCEGPILRARDGRPVLEARAGELQPAISLAHSQGFIAAAHGFVSRLGIDLECIGRPRDIQGIAELAFGPDERRQVAQDGPEAFYRIWTAREALAKATGRALQQVTDRRDYFAAVISDDTAHLHVDGGAWTVMHTRPSADVFIAIVWQD